MLPAFVTLVSTGIGFGSLNPSDPGSFGNCLNLKTNYQCFGHLTNQAILCSGDPLILLYPTSQCISLTVGGCRLPSVGFSAWYPQPSLSQHSGLYLGLAIKVSLRT